MHSCHLHALEQLISEFPAVHSRRQIGIRLKLPVKMDLGGVAAQLGNLFHWQVCSLNLIFRIIDSHLNVILLKRNPE